ncbi:hypothetical protein [Brevundimonas sp.]|uniref:hypothetical protein n=1 Tax=Brevundimonas sp. TaxID=1871086 RepID=UPI002D354A91|nr:hypothetical protein [Brevundimonas sp.]HYC75228.1 hypothetical protein [Brevundimonas sp.]
MVRIAFSLAVAVVATPAAAQVISSGVPMGPGGSGTEVLGNPSDAGIMSTTPSRIASSRREMNRGRETSFQVRMSPRQARLHARELVGRADIMCDVAEAEIVAYTEDNIPLMEIDCAVGGGLVIADTLPIQAMDCLDLAMPEDQAEQGGYMLTCRLPGNVAVVNAARQSARN